MNPMQEFVVYGFFWCFWIGSMLGLLIVVTDDNRTWRKSIPRLNKLELIKSAGPKDFL